MLIPLYLRTLQLSQEAAEKLLQGDPFHQNGIFVRWVMRPWNAVIANRELFPA